MELSRRGTSPLALVGTNCRRCRLFCRAGHRAFTSAVSPNAVGGQEPFKLADFDHATPPDLDPGEFALVEKLVNF